jgi:hypothetical protein
MASRIQEGGGGIGSSGANRMTTGKAKKMAEPSKMYNPPVKGSGKPKYQNVVKESRLNTKKKPADSIIKVKEKILGKKVTQQEKRAIRNKVDNIPKVIDREAKEKKGQRTAKPSTPKVPVKKVSKK